VTAVGVLVPVYDQAAFLPRALEGLLAQDLADWTALVLDDGSPDASAVDDVVRGLGDPGCGCCAGRPTAGSARR
jgi:hypothetical protein